MSEKFKNLTKKQKSIGGIAILILLLLVIWACVSLNKKDTEIVDSNVETVETASTELVAEVETIEATETETIETESVVESEEVIETETVSETEVPENTEIIETEEVAVLSEAVPSNIPTDTIISTPENPVKPVSGKSYLKYDEAGYIDYYESWTTGKTWTASNGVVLKINDFGQDIDASNPKQRLTSTLWWHDPDANYEPESAWMKATEEYILADEAYENGMQRFDSTVVDISKLPAVSTVSSKQSSITMTDEFKAYKEMWDVYAGFQNSGEMKASPLNSLQVNSDFIGSAVDGQGYFWEIRKDGDCWKLTIRKNLASLDWHGLKTALKLITPDAEALYNEFYKQCYEDNPTFPEYDMWVNIGGSQAMTSVSDYSYFYFK